MRHPALSSTAPLRVAAAALLAAAAAPAQEPELAGSWSGPARYREDETRITLHLERQADQSLQASLDVPCTNVAAAPLGAVTRDGDRYHVLTFEFRLDAAAGTLQGEFQTGPHQIRFELARDSEEGGSGAAGTPAEPTAAPAAGGTAEIPVARPAWTFTAGGPIWSPATVEGDLVSFGCNDGKVYALQAATGARAWEFATGAPVLARPTFAGGALYVNSDDGHLYKRDARSGEPIWSFDTHAAGLAREFPALMQGSYDSFASSPLVAGDTVYAGSADGRMYAVDAATGQERWHYQTGDRVRSTPALAAGRLVFGSFDRCVYALDPAHGELAWKYDTTGAVTSSPAVADGRVFIGSRSADVFALDAASGHVDWSTFLWMSWVESSGTVRDGALYVGSSDFQALSALDLKDGHALWRFDTDGSAWSSPAVTERSVCIGAAGTVGYMADHRGAFFVVDRASGRARWRYPFQPIPGAFIYGVVGSPAVAQGRVFFGALDGVFYAFPEG